VRLFVAENQDGTPSELTRGTEPTVRVSSPDLSHARRARARIRAAADDVAVILDVAVVVADDFRSARTALDAGDNETADTVRYAGTVDGLAGLIADIESAGVADGVTLISASPQQDLRAVGLDVLDWLAVRGHPRAS
jgi:hypothetical protein